MPDSHFGGDDFRYRAEYCSADIKDMIFPVRPEIVSYSVSGDEYCSNQNIIRPAKNYEKYDKPEDEKVPDKNKLRAVRFIAP